MIQNQQMANALKQQMIQNPVQFAQNALRSGHFNNSPMHKRALEAVVNGDNEQLDKIARNQCLEHNVSLEDAKKQYMQYYGLG